MVHLLHLADEETVLKFRQESLSIYTGGYYSATGDTAPGHLLSHCAVLAQTMAGLLLAIGYTGSSSRKEARVYSSVQDAYLEAIKMVLIEKANDRSARGARLDISPLANSAGRWPVGGHKVFSIIRDISTGERKLETKTRSWAIDSAAMRRMVGDCLHFWLWLGVGRGGGGGAHLSPPCRIYG